MNLADWHQRFAQQAQWTGEIRHHLFSQAHLQPDDRILEVGSGTGAVLNQIASESTYSLTGIDLDLPRLTFSHGINPRSKHALADGHQLPFQQDCFSASFCHYLLLWVRDPAQVLAEMQRVTRSGGAVIALAEPDYAHRIDAPPAFEELGRLQTDSLIKQGARVEIGRQLGLLFQQAGFTNIEGGILGAQWVAKAQDSDETEWMTLQEDLAEESAAEELSTYHDIDQVARTSGIRVLFIPTFYWMGVVP